MVLDDEVERLQGKKMEEMLRRISQPTRASPSAITSGVPIDLSDADFHATVRRHPVMVVDFWAPWCGPCRLVSPVFEELSRELAGKVTFGKLNVDDNQAVPREFGIQGIPTIMIFKDGEPVDGLVGAAPKSMIEQRIKPYIGDGSRATPYQ